MLGRDQLPRRSARDAPATLPRTHPVPRRGVSHALVVNAYAIGNHGDAAIVQGLIHSLREAGASHVTVAPRGWRTEQAAWHALGADGVVRPLISQHDAPAWARLHRIGLLAYVVLRMVWLALLARLGIHADAAARAYRDADVVVSAGGAYLGGPKVGINLVKAANIAFARSARRPMIIAPMTINPPGGGVRRLLRWALRGATVFVRDVPSRQRLARMGIGSTVVPDLAFRAPAVVAASSRSEPPRATGYLCWSPRSYRPDHDAWAERSALEEACVAAVTAVLRSTDLRVRFVPQVTASAEDDDRAAIDRLRSMLPPDVVDRVEACDPAPDVAGAVEQFASCEVLLASRLHASILAMASGVPSLSVAYEPKVAGVLSGIGLDNRVIAVDASVTADDIAARLLQLREPAESDRTREAGASTRGAFAPFDVALRKALAS
jgi:colanic acid/amylovoran biosynthesis protein